MLTHEGTAVTSILETQIGSGTVSNQLHSHLRSIVIYTVHVFHTMCTRSEPDSRGSVQTTRAKLSFCHQLQSWQDLIAFSKIDTGDFML